MKILSFIVVFCLMSIPSFGQTKNLTEVENTKKEFSEIKISHANALFSIAKYFKKISGELKAKDGLFGPITFVPEGDSIGSYSVDKYHNNVFKETRKMLFSKYDSITSYVNQSFLNENLYGKDTLYYALFECDYLNNKIYINEYNVGFYDLKKLKTCVDWLNNFADLINYEAFLKENESIYNDYLQNKTFKIEDMLIWLNDMFELNYKKIAFKTSPFAHPFDLDVYDSANSSVLNIVGGIYVTDKECDYTSEYRFFSRLLDHYLYLVIDEMGKSDQVEEIMLTDRLNGIVGQMNLALYLLYCYDVKSKNLWENELKWNCCKMEEYGFENYKEEVKSLLKEIIKERDKKKLRYIYIDILEKRKT